MHIKMRQIQRGKAGFVAIAPAIWQDRRAEK
jgi:hypothetical protein